MASTTMQISGSIHRFQASSPPSSSAIKVKPTNTHAHAQRNATLFLSVVFRLPCCCRFVSTYVVLEFFRMPRCLWLALAELAASFSRPSPSPVSLTFTSLVLFSIWIFPSFFFSKGFSFLFFWDLSFWVFLVRVLVLLGFLSVLIKL